MQNLYSTKMIEMTLCYQLNMFIVCHTKIKQTMKNLLEIQTFQRANHIQKNK